MCLGHKFWIDTNSGATPHERRGGRAAGGGARGARHHRRRRPSRRRLQIHGFAGALRLQPRRREHADARLAGDERSRLHLSSRRGDPARREIARARHGHQRSLQSVLRRDGDRHRGGLPGRRFHPLHRQHGRESRPSVAGHPLDARIWRGGAGAVAGDSEFGVGVEAAVVRYAGRAGDAPAAGPARLHRRAGEPARRAQGGPASHRPRPSGASPSSAAFLR